MDANSTGAIEALLSSFEQHLLSAHGLSSQSVPSQRRRVREFLSWVFGGSAVDPARLQPGHVVEYVSANASRCRPGTSKLVCSALRTFFRFLRTQGVVDHRLEEAVPTVARWRLSALPRSLSEADRARLLASLDDSTPRARRDRAIVLSLAMLGLRAGEVVNLQVEDIHWRAGTVEVRCRKVRRGAILPLPRVMGQALAAYLRSGRPHTSDRHVFLVHCGPTAGSPIRSHVVAQALQRCLAHAGIRAPTQGARLMRHTFATHMVRRGASLREIADLLGHRSLDTTTIYAKVDLSALGEMPLPWPEVVS